MGKESLGTIKQCFLENRLAVLDKSQKKKKKDYKRQLFPFGEYILGKQKKKKVFAHRYLWPAYMLESLTGNNSAAGEKAK